MRLSILAIGAALVAGTTAAGEERLVAPLYPGPPPWSEVTNQSNANSWIREQIPRDQQLESYRDILTIQGFPKRPGMTPASFLRGVFASAQNACEAIRVNGPVEKTEGGHRVAYAQVYCGRQRGQSFGVNMLFKVIEGGDRIYAVNRDFRVRA